jgi:NAD(P)-dependent dehydrogenase (short-subunit alcohol dehydrogenase family)
LESTQRPPAGLAPTDPDANGARSLDGRVALVTGGAGDLGRGVASALATRGAIVICADIRDGAEVAGSLPGGRGRAVVLDVTDPGEVERVIARLARDHGRLDVLVNNAGVAHRPAPLVETSDATIDRVLTVNVKGVLHCARAAARVMIAQATACAWGWRPARRSAT